MSLKSSMRILIIDNISNMRQATRKMLNEIGFKNVKDCGDAKSAWKVIEEQNQLNEPFEFILCEFDLPDQTGVEFLKQLRSDSSLAKVPVLMVTGNSQQAVIVQAIQAGANNFLIKPFSAQNLMEKVAVIFKQNQGPKKKAS
jgi:two-component system chemotaxis response regulator CheY